MSVVVRQTVSLAILRFCSELDFRERISTLGLSTGPHIRRGYWCSWPTLAHTFGAEVGVVPVKQNREG